eukprot:scaffold199647_cov26-Tisochrysis_lutea.AAC.2
MCMQTTAWRSIVDMQQPACVACSKHKVKQLVHGLTQEILAIEMADYTVKQLVHALLHHKRRGILKASGGVNHPCSFAGESLTKPQPGKHVYVHHTHACTCRKPSKTRWPHLSPTWTSAWRVTGLPTSASCLVSLRPTLVEASHPPWGAACLHRDP